MAKLKKHKKKVKIKIPKIQRTKTGRKFVKIGKKTVYLDDDVTPNQLLKFILNRIIKKPQKRVKSDKTVTDSKRTIHIARPTSTVSSGGLDRVAQLIDEQKRDLERKGYEKKLVQKIDDEMAAKAPKYQMLMQGSQQSSPKPPKRKGFCADLMEKERNRKNQSIREADQMNYYPILEKLLKRCQRKCLI